MTEFTLPDLGEGLHEAEILQWHVSIGDRIVRDQPLVDVETDKAVVEVPAPWSGTVVELYAEAGDIVDIGAPLVAIRKEETMQDQGSLVGRLPEVRHSKERSDAPKKPSVVREKRIKAAPAIRKRADELGIDLSAVTGTGPDGTVSGRDLEKYSANGWQELRGVRRTMARNMTIASSQIAATTVTEIADVSQWESSEDVTVRLVSALVEACRAVPALNAWYDGRR